MKKWLHEKKKAIILSVAVTLLPVLVGLLLWNQLPDTLLIHWNGGGAADGAGTKAFAVFGIPLIMAAVNFLCLMLTGLDKKAREQNNKGLNLIFWMMPVISLVCCGFIYAAALGRAMDVSMVIPLLLGVLFVVIGNFMPKVKQNSSMGIKCIWTLSNEENWNKTHRFAGKVWVAAGVILLLSAVLPFIWSLILSVAVALLAGIVPMMYSYRIYREHKAEGIVYEMTPKTKKQKTTAILSAVLVVAILVFVAGIMFTGDITYTVQEDSLRIEAHYVGGMEVSYDIIDSVELRESFDVGVRAFGFGSPRLSMGTFENDEFKVYSIYSYNSCESMILIRSGDKVLAINAKTEAETQKLYETLLTKIG